MYAPERHQAITAMVVARGRVAVADVATEFGVTTETVRRDLDYLDRAGLLRRVHGGALPTTTLTALEHTLSERLATRSVQKERIARAALEMLPGDGGSILLDAGTTTGALASQLPMDRRLTVVTNSVHTAAGLVGRGALQVHLLGGRVRRTTHAAVGPEAVHALGDLTVDVAFLGANGVSAVGLTTPDPEEAAAKRAMVSSGRTVVVLADSSKLGQAQLIRFAALDQIDMLITDKTPDDQAGAQLRGHEVEVVVA